MRKIVLSLVTILAAVAMVAGATSAVFSATDSIPGNTITAATVTLDAHNYSGNKPIGVVLTKLIPGMWTPEGRAELYNTGNTDVKVYMSVANMTGVACDKVNLKVYTGWAGGDEHVRTVYDYKLDWLTTNRQEVTGNPPFALLGPNWSQVIWQKAQLDATADNTYQGDTCTWEEVFTAETP